MKETVVSLNIFPGSVETILVFSFRIAVCMQTLFLFYVGQISYSLYRKVSMSLHAQHFNSLDLCSW